MSITTIKRKKSEPVLIRHDDNEDMVKKKPL